MSKHWTDTWCVDCQVICACGSPEFPHMREMAFPLTTSEAEIKRRLEEARHELCPGCLLDAQYQQAIKMRKERGLKHLVGSSAKSVKAAEVTRATIYMHWMHELSEQEVAQLPQLLNRARNRHASIWINFREACWERGKRAAFLTLLQKASAA